MAMEELRTGSLQHQVLLRITEGPLFQTKLALICCQHQDQQDLRLQAFCTES